ncbi:hypothetical protein GQ55_5G075500 [Panicum hallii var. hallii]|uniref:Major facilitator superfamily (MFS) profile domain-containing protein n=1 Tax=Panicum hallii var. hallii TaxID=1504633 RepID=A0A2T7DDR9_9POAL|nr:hypothetical protein GQ55_5G075500 [Panicum hallii var. hallii]
MQSGELLPGPWPSLGSKPADGRGGWRAARFVLAVGFLERIGFYGVQGNLIMYLTGPLGMSTASAAAGVNAWAGAVQVLPLAGALAADSRLGRYRAVLAAGGLYLLSLGMLTISSMLQGPQPHAAGGSPSSAMLAFFYVALYLLALAQAFHRPCVEALGADQFAPGDGGDPGASASRSSYFNWFHFSVSWGYAIATAGLSYVEGNVGWTAGFGACWATMALYLAVFLLGTRAYRAEKPVGVRSFTESVRSWGARVFRRSDATDAERLLLAQEHEEGKELIVKLLPIWLTSLIIAAIFSQVYTLFTKQGSTLDRRLGGATTGLVVPPAALQCLMSATFVTTLQARHGVTTLQRIGAGMAVSGVAMAVAALVEGRRLRVARDAGLVDRPDVALPMSLWWVEFFYDQVPDTLRSVGLAMCLSIFGMGSYASSMLVSAVDWVTRSKGESWFSDNLNRARLDYFYWLLAGLAALEVAAFLHFASRYVYRNEV